MATCASRRRPGSRRSQNVPLRAGADRRPAARHVLQRLSFLQDVYGAEPDVPHRAQTRPSTACPIQTALANITRATPVKSWYYHRRAVTWHWAIATTMTGAVHPEHARQHECGQQHLLRVAVCRRSDDRRPEPRTPSHTKVLGTTTLNEARFSWINRDLQFPENDPDSPTAGIGGLPSPSAGSPTSRRAACRTASSSMDVLTFQQGRHSFKAGADIRYIDLDNVAAFDSEGHVHV